MQSLSNKAISLFFKNFQRGKGLGQIKFKKMRLFLAAALVAVIGVSHNNVEGGVLKSKHSVLLSEEPKAAEAASTDTETKAPEPKPLTPEQAVKKIAKTDPTVLNEDGNLIC